MHDTIRVIKKSRQNRDYSFSQSAFNVSIISSKSSWGEEKFHGVQVLMNYNEKTRDYEYNKDAVPNIMLAKITVLEYTGKINPVRNK